MVSLPPGDLSEVGASSGCHDWAETRDAAQRPAVPRLALPGDDPAPNVGGAQGEPGDGTERGTTTWDGESSDGLGVPVRCVVVDSLLWCRGHCSSWPV